jgi:hypothetical protein
MVRLLLLFLVSLLSFTIQAQTTPPSTSAPAQATTARTELTTGRRDTLRAVRNLFERRRAGGRRWLYVTGGGVLAMTRAIISSNSTTNGVRTREVAGSEIATAFGLLVGLPAAIGVGKLVRFSDKREEAITVPYTTGQRLPRGIARRLRKKDFE